MGFVVAGRFVFWEFVRKVLGWRKEVFWKFILVVLCVLCFVNVRLEDSRNIRIKGLSGGGDVI